MLFRLDGSEIGGRINIGSLQQLHVDTCDALQTYLLSITPSSSSTPGGHRRGNDRRATNMCATPPIPTSPTEVSPRPPRRTWSWVAPAEFQQLTVRQRHSFT